MPPSVPLAAGETGGWYVMKGLSRIEISVIKARILRGDKYAEIAADYRVNQGRIADLKFGRIHGDIEPADLSDPGEAIGQRQIEFSWPKRRN